MVSVHRLDGTEMVVCAHASMADYRQDSLKSAALKARINYTGNSIDFSKKSHSENRCPYTNLLKTIDAVMKKSHGLCGSLLQLLQFCVQFTLREFFTRFCICSQAPHSSYQHCLSMAKSSLPRSRSLQHNLIP